jgi:hypothetical protein
MKRRSGSFGSIDKPLQISGLSQFFVRNLQGAVRLLVHTPEKRGIAGVVANGVEKWVHTDECHVEAVAVERMPE